MTDTNARIRAKGLEKTGVTEEYATKMFAAGANTRYMAVIELKVKQPHGPDDEGNRSVDLVIENIELAPTGDTDEHLRRLIRSFHYERGLAENGPQLPMPGDHVEPTVEEVRAAGEALIEDDGSLWDGQDGDQEPDPDDQEDQEDQGDDGDIPGDDDAQDHEPVGSPFATT